MPAFTGLLNTAYQYNYLTLQQAHDGITSAMVCSKEYVITSSIGSIKVIVKTHIACNIMIVLMYA